MVVKSDKSQLIKGLTCTEGTATKCSLVMDTVQRIKLG